MNGDFTVCAVQLLQNSLVIEMLKKMSSCLYVFQICLSFVIFLHDITLCDTSHQQKTLRTYHHESQWALVLPETAEHCAAQASSQMEQHKA